MDINVTEDLSILTNQIQQKKAELEQLTTKREQLTQEIHHLNGVAMYLRGKQQSAVEEPPPDDTNNEED